MNIFQLVEDLREYEARMWDNNRPGVSSRAQARRVLEEVNAIAETANEADDARCGVCGAFLRKNANGELYCPIHEFNWGPEGGDTAKEQLEENE